VTVTVAAPQVPLVLPVSLEEALARLAEAEDTLRAIGAGEVDAFVVSDGGTGHQVFTLSTADRPYRMFVENMREGAATLSSNGLILFANRRLAEMLSCPKEWIVGSPLSSFVSETTPVDLDQIRGAGGRGATLEFDLSDAEGTAVPVLVGTSPLAVDGNVLMCLTFTDLSAQRAQDREIARLSDVQGERLADLQDAQAALTEQATHDALTGLPNRGLLVDRIDQALAQSRRSGQCTAVLFVDLDGFKQINDTQGHAAGDLVLQRVAGQMVSALRPMDTIARIGGDEFVVLAPEVDDHLHAADIGARLVTELCRRPEARSDGEPVTASIGIAVSDGGRGDAEVLLNEADMAMYRAKSLGGARAETFDAALGLQIRRRLMALHMLQSALDDDRVIPYFQPVIDLASGRVAGFEALARMVEEDGCIVPPAGFIPVAEDSGLVVPLGARILALACREAASWPVHEAGGGRSTIAVNLSPRQFERGDLEAVVREVLARTGLAPERLHFEITETAIIELHPDILRQLGQVRDLGVEVGLDDFGTGYASLTHLRRLPLTFVKIDRTFVQGLGSDDEDDRIVSAVVELAANLDLRSIAEGVETSDQLARLRALGCDQAQGYLFARPHPADGVAAALAHDPW
jgi:diguanylate cyclase (GGDEF)-like protein